MADSVLPGTWIEIDEQVIASNIRTLAGMARKRGQDFMLMVKANAYGHGLVEMSLLAQKEGAKFLGVTEIEDAILLRSEGVTAPILLFGEPRPERIPELFEYSVTPVVASLSFLDEFARQADKPTKLHLKVNTGLNRFGVSPDDMDAFIKLLSAHPQLQLEGMLTHYSAADHDLEATKRQLKSFMDCVQKCKQAGFAVPIIHASNSAGTAWMDEQHTNLVRLGLSAYGLQPANDKHIDVAQSFTWKARLIAVSTVKKGGKVGYGGAWTAERDSRIGVVSIGYYDGFRRGPSNFGFVLCRGVKVPIVGRVMMNHTMVDLTDISGDVSVNEEVVLIGEQAGQRITFEEAGEHAGTINEEVATAIRDTILRVYQNKPE